MLTKKSLAEVLWRNLPWMLAAGAVVALASALSQTHQYSAIYDQIARANAVYAESTRAAREVVKTAQLVNAPANDVFSSHDIPAERQRFASAARALDESLNRLIAGETSADLVVSARSTTAEMREATESTFRALEQNRPGTAGVAMARVDRLYARLLAIVETLRGRHLEAQLANTALYQSTLRSVGRSELTFALFGVLATLSVLLYGSRRVRVGRVQRGTDLANQQVLDAVSSSLIMAVMDNEGRIIDVNENMCRISGYGREEVLGLNHQDLSSNAHPPEFFAQIWAQISSGRSWAGDVANRRKDGELYYMRSFITPILGLDGQIVRYLKVCYDQTEQTLITNSYLEAQSIAMIGSWHMDFGSKRLTWSPEMYSIFEMDGPLPPEVLFEKCAERIHPEDLPEIARVMAHSMETGEDYVINHRVYLDKGQRIKYVRSIGKVLRDQHGLARALSGTCQDLSEFITLQKQNKFILESMGIGIWKFNPVTQDLYWDDSLYGLYELNPADFSGHYEAWRSSLTDDAAAKAVQELQAALSGEKDFNTTFEIVTKSGGRKYIGGQGVVVRNDEKQPIMMFGINWDRTREVLMEASLQHERAKSLHSAKLASLGEMSAGIAHEINNPLAVIAGTVPLLQKFRNDEAKFSAKLEMITKSTGRIEKIVRGLRKFSRSSEGSVRNTERISQIIVDALIITEAKSKRHATPITTDLADDAFVTCDTAEIEQVLVNLVNNAVDAVKLNAERWVKITAFAQDEHVVVRVIDSGSGITDEIEKKLTQPFFTTKVVGEGTGLGLSITKGILDAHKATFALNRAFATTCFEIRFVRAVAPAAEGNRVA